MRAVAFTEDLVGVEMLKEEVIMDKPVYIGQAVLDLSKLIMYRWRYDHLASLEEQLGGKIKVIGGDTDSLFLKLKNIKAESLLERMVQDDLLDTSNFNKNHPLHSNKNKAKLGCVKSESNHIIYFL